jgi:hypothetical protein
MWKPWPEGGDRDVPAAAYVGRGTESGGGQGAPRAQPAQGGTHGLAHGLRSEQILEETMCIQDSASSRRHTLPGSWTQVRTDFKIDEMRSSRVVKAPGSQCRSSDTVESEWRQMKQC